MKKRRVDANERPANLLFWLKDGMCGRYDARVKADVRVSIGRTNSERALGFWITNADKHVADFVLNKDQVTELAAFLQLALLGLRKPLGREPDQMSLVPWAEEAAKQMKRREKRKQPKG